MAEITTPVIDPSPRGPIRYDSVDAEKGTISSGYVNPEDRNKPSAIKEFVDKYGPRALLNTIKTGLGLNSPWTPEEQARLDDIKSRKGAVVGNPQKAAEYKKTLLEPAAKNATNPTRLQKI